MAMVTVYAFTADEIATDRGNQRPVKATREAIEHFNGAILIEASAEEIDASLLDGNGVYRPNATE